MKTRIIGSFHPQCRNSARTDKHATRDTTSNAKTQMEANIIDLAKQCPEITISIKASDLIEAGRTIKEELLQDLGAITPGQQPAEEETFFSRDETMNKLKISSTTLWRWKKCGYLVPVQLGSMDRYRLSDINAILIQKGGAL